MAKTKTQKLSQKIFDQIMKEESDIFEKMWDLVEILKKSGKRTLPTPENKLIHELDWALFRRMELITAWTITEEFEEEK